MNEMNPNVSIQVDMTTTINFSLLNAGLPILRTLEISNPSETGYSNITLTVNSDCDIVEPVSKEIDYLAPASSLTIKDLKLCFNIAELASLTEKTTATLNFCLSQKLLTPAENDNAPVEESITLCTQSKDITILAFDEWSGSGICPEILASFCVPNHPAVSTILSRASVILQNWTGDPSFDAYQTENPDRVLKQAAAIYSTLVEQNLVYCVSPASFEDFGQRIRLIDTCLEQKMGNCIDLSLCYCSCLEAAGLHPFLVLKSGHAFAGVWLEDMTFPESVQYDPASVTKRMAGGVNELTVIECTCMTAGKTATFEEACAAAFRHFNEPDSIEYIIDIKRARMSQITPLPMRIKTENGYEISRESLEPARQISAPSGVVQSEVTFNNEETVFSRKTLWERKLLDLGLRNQLINLRMSKCLVPLLTPSLDILEDRLADGSEFTVQPRPTDFEIAESSITFDNLHEVFPNKELLESEFKSKRLRSSLNEAQLSKTIKELYRSAKTSLEENGANTLYMALGLLRWYETEKSVKPRYAPIVLIPIDMVRKSAGSGYTIRLRDDEPQMNITILEKLKQDFKLNINGLDPLPTDEHGIDLRAVFTILRKSIMSLSKWDILESAYLGIFTFSQFVMWNDIRNRSQDLEKNKIVKSLVDQKLSWDAEPMIIEGKVNEDDVLLPLSADASQAFAIKEAAKGTSFVLHGPPGTGKSQTITALIANALASGKKVLFVAEKMAALSVVEKRLSKLGIGDFCLELHSNKSRKRDVLDQLDAACRITKSASPEEYAKSAEKIQKLRQELDKYSLAIHRKEKCGYSCYELINIYEENIGAPDTVILSGDSLSQLDEAAFESCNETVMNLVAAGKAMGHPHGHPLTKIKISEYDHALSDRISGSASQYIEKAKDIRPEVESICNLFAISTPVEYIQLQNMLELVELVNSCFNYPSDWFLQDNYPSFFSSLTALCDSFISQLQAYNSISTKWTEAFFTMDAGTLLNEYREAQGAFLFMKGIKMNSLVKQLSFCSKTGVNKDTLADELTSLLNYKTIENSNAKLLLNMNPTINNLPHSTEADWTSLRNKAAEAQLLLDRLTALNPDPAFRKKLCTDTSQKPLLERMLSKKKEFDAAQNSFYRAIGSTPSASAVSEGHDFLTSEINDCTGILNGLDGLKDLCLWNHFSEQAVSFRIGSVAKAYAGGMAHEDVLPSYYKAMSNALISHIVDNDEYLKTFSDAMFNDKIRQFKELDAKVMELTKKEIYAKLAARVPNFQAASAQSSETGILQRAIKSNGRGTSIRKLFSQIPNLLPRLTPCMLMSPLSAAQYLDPAFELFDLVVFDEASQLTTAKAVGAIARGKDAVIVGDPNQMPPTSFFMSDATDEDNLDSEDLESILDDCLAIELPQTHLLWHYRSRHESLIAFSNSEFYENRLFTFPSVNDRESKVSFVHVDGYFDRGKTRQNHAEAEAVVEEIKRRFHDESSASLSLGVVTFNISQSNLIDDLITEACSNDPALEDWLYNQEEPLFIKNLENVQGDERDVILFSVGYGTDKDGKTYMNFGPLNRDGGWRRLNVAVSRARYEMKVFSSLTSDQINLARTNSQGVAALKSFLVYAEKGILQNNMAASTKKSDTAGTIASICKVLQENGYKTATDIGHSGYRIDIGVLHPDDPTRYLLGILIDGPVYASAQTTRDRELSQISVLEGLGWSITRIWSIGWWDNRKRELDSLLKKLDEVYKKGNSLKNAGANSVKPAPRNNTVNNVAGSTPAAAENIPETAGTQEAQENVSRIEAAAPSTGNTAPVSEPEPPVFTAAILEPVLSITAEELLSPGHRKDIQQRMKTVLDAEAPLPKDVLYKKVLASYGITRSTAKITELMNSCLDVLKVQVTQQFEDDFVWSKQITPDTLNFFRTSGTSSPDRRDIKAINLAEIEQAVIYVTEHQISLSMEDLIRETAKLFGYTRTGETISNYISGGIHFAMIDNRIRFDANGRIVLCD